jgi:hypothetical protein
VKLTVTKFQEKNTSSFFGRCMHHWIKVSGVKKDDRGCPEDDCEVLDDWEMAADAL